MINLTKGDSPVSLTKSQEITLRCSWDSNTDYDLYALILRTDGFVETVALFPAEGIPAQEKSSDGTVVHGGDARRGGSGAKSETISVSLNDTIRAVVPVVYSARSNGTGSFFHYKVTMDVLAGSPSVRVDAAYANDNDRIYTCVPGWIENAPEGALVHHLEAYSRPNSEYRPHVQISKAKKGILGGFSKGSRVEILMDAGPENQYK